MWEQQWELLTSLSAECKWNVQVWLSTCNAPK